MLYIYFLLSLLSCKDCFWVIITVYHSWCVLCVICRFIIQYCWTDIWSQSRKKVIWCGKKCMSALTEFHFTWGAAPNAIDCWDLKVVLNILEYAIRWIQCYLNSWGIIWSIRFQHQNWLVHITISSKAQVIVGHWISSTCIGSLGDIKRSKILPVGDTFDNSARGISILQIVPM